MSKKSSTEIAKRQLAENFSEGDHLRFAVVVEGCVVARDQAESGDWLMSIRIANINSTTSETIGKGADRKLTERVRPVFWSTTKDGDIELVLEVGARQRLLAVGISAKQKQTLRRYLQAMPVDEAEELLREMASFSDCSVNSDGHLSNRKSEGNHHE